MLRSQFRLMLVAAVVFPIACARSPRPAGRESSPAAQPDDKPAPAGRAPQVLRARLAAPPPASSADPQAGDIWAAVRRLYEANSYQPVWWVDGKPRPEIATLRAAVARAAEDGLDPAEYDLRPGETLLAARGGHGLFDRRPSIDMDAAMDADVRLSYAFLKLATHLERGRVPPGQVDPHWFGTQRQEDLATVLRTSLASGRFEQTLDTLRPQHPQYAALKSLLARYREVAAHGGWPTLPPTVALRAGKPDPQVAVLRAHLVATGDLPASVAAPALARPAVPPTPAAPVFDAETQAALKRFQRRHGLTASGRVDRATLAALEIPLEDRIRQIELNLERWRWLPETLGERYVLVNIPTFQLTAVDHGQVQLQMRVVTGKQGSPTPIFSDDMTTVVFSPYWNVPPDIARNETIPAAMRDPGYLERNDLEVVRAGHVVDPSSVNWSQPGNIQFRQRPGERNALGGVKFLFPNQFDVYLHDTPADALFARVERDYSHGCVRIEKPFEMAEWVLQGRPEWTPERIKAAMAAGREQQIPLKRKFPVYIVYETVWVDDDGAAEFRDDIYGHDARQERIVPLGPRPGGVQVAGQAVAMPSVRQVAETP